MKMFSFSSHKKSGCRLGSYCKFISQIGNPDFRGLEWPAQAQKKRVTETRSRLEAPALAAK